MKQELIVEGMTCNGCVATVKEKLENVAGVDSAQVTLNPPLAIVESSKEVALKTLQEATGKYSLKSTVVDLQIIDMAPSIDEEEIPKNFDTYRPLFLIVLFIAGVSFLAQYPLDSFDFMLWMRHFMAGFFIVFSFFKLLNISGFADSYSMYDIVAKRWKNWGYIYPFVELGLGISYLINFAPFWTNIITIVVLGISSIGVVESNLNKRKIKCACLGDVFNLPMSTVTIVEDVTMVLMAGAMLFLK